MKISFLLAGLLFFSNFAFAISDNDRDEFYKDSREKIIPLFDSRSTQFFEGVEGKKIAYMTFPANNEKGAIIFVNGRCEPMKKYREIIYDLAVQGYSLYVLDHRGQGYSDRVIDDDREKSHVKKFEHYVEDLNTFVETIVKPKDHGKTFVVAHSMGGAIATLYLHRYKPAIQGAVFSSPMFEINLGKYSRTQANALLLKAWLTRSMDKYVPNGKGYNKNEAFDENQGTNSLLRWEVTRKVVEDEPELGIGSPTYRWVGTALKATDKIMKNAKKIEYPILILEAGNDQIVHPRGEEKFLKLNKMAQILRFPKAKHEIFVETDEFRAPAMEATLDFLSKH